MVDLLSSIAEHSGTSDDDLRKAGKAAGDDMPAEHKKFLADLIAKIDGKEINPLDPETLVNRKVYDALPEMDRGKIDLNRVNMASQIQRIEDFFRNKATPNASPELKTMIEHLWDIKKKMEEQYGSLFTF